MHFFRRKIVRNTSDFRCVCRRVKPKNFTERVEFIPVEWRSKVALDGDMVESITPKKVMLISSRCYRALKLRGVNNPNS